MATLALTLGLLLILLVLVDAVTTTIAPRGAGPLTGLLGRLIWRLALAIHHRRPLHRLLQVIGTLIPLATVLSWVALLWAGWTLVFLVDPRSVVASSNELPGGLAERAYFVGYTLATLGLGDFVPGSDLWRWLVPLASLNGLFVATLGITYLMPVVSADIDKRALASMVDSLGDTPEQIVSRVDWRGDLSGAETVLAELGASVARHAERHLAYPVLHYLHATTVSEAATPALARLDEAVTLIVHGLAVERRPSTTVLRVLRGALTRYIEVVPGQVAQVDGPPPPPSLDELRRAGLPTVSQAHFERQLEALAQRRLMFRRLVVNDGWQWADVSPERPD